MSLVPLGATARFINGAAFKPSDWGAEGLPIIRIQNLTGTGEEFNYTTRQVKPEIIVEPGDLLVSWSATLDVYRWAGSRGVLNQHIFKVIPNKGVDPEYLYFALKSVIAELQGKTHGSTMKHVVRGDFEGTRIPLPPLDEQRKIVDLLSRAEGIVRLRREAQKKAAEIIPALFVDMFGDPETNSKGWPETQLATLSAVQGGLQLSKARASLPLERPYLRVANVHRGRLDLSEVKTMHMTEVEFERTKLTFGDLLVVEGHGNAGEIGRVGIWDGSIEGCVHQNHLIRVRCNAKVIKPEFACEYLNSASGRQSLLRSGKTTSGLNTISVSNVKSASILVPPVALQETFVERLTLLRSVATQQLLSLQGAESNFAALLERAFAPGREALSMQVTDMMAVA